ncbi:hypothetical protein [Mariniblastus fucicola]|nr:hypothetical protein [Mariniblastus fucicola]
MSEEELIQLVQRIRGASGCMVDLDGLLGKFEANVQDSTASQWIFESSTGRLMTPEEVVRKAGVKPKP